MSLIYTIFISNPKNIPCSIYHGEKILQDFLQFFLIGLIIVFSILTVEVKNLFRATLIFAVMCISIAILFWMLGAYYVAVFQLLIYAGAMIVMLLAVVALTAGKEREMK